MLIYLNQNNNKNLSWPSSLFGNIKYNDISIKVILCPFKHSFALLIIMGLTLEYFIPQIFIECLLDAWDFYRCRRLN